MKNEGIDRPPNITVISRHGKTLRTADPFKIIFHRYGRAKKYKKGIRRDVINVVRNVRKRIIDFTQHLRRVSTDENWSTARITHN